MLVETAPAVDFARTAIAAAELIPKKKYIINEKSKLIANYEELGKSLQINQKKLEIAKKRYEIKKKENELDRASYLDVIDAYKTYLAQGIETKKVKNDLNAFMYKIEIKASYEVKSEEAS